jgi:prepilin-type N-terminal cleavage/methylation domain-containing protein
MHKAKGFTLAEVLITLGIIGIVAALTIPTIIGNSDKQVVVGKVKEIYSILSLATGQINGECDGTIMGCLSKPAAIKNDSDSATTRVEIVNLYKQKLSVFKDCTSGGTGCFPPATTLLNNNPCTNFEADGNFTNARIVLQNGMALAFEYNGPTWTPNYFYIYVDINGTKLPNQLGKDTFSFYYNIDRQTIIPTSGGNCYLPGGSGYGCAALLLREGAISYY